MSQSAAWEATTEFPMPDGGTVIIRSGNGNRWMDQANIARLLGVSLSTVCEMASRARDYHIANGLVARIDLWQMENSRHGMRSVRRAVLHYRVDPFVLQICRRKRATGSGLEFAAWYAARFGEQQQVTDAAS